MQRYQVTLEGVTPLLMHSDNLAFGEKLSAWRKDPVNREASAAGDDRSPPWTWLGYAYHDSKVLGLPSDNLMTMLREGGAKVKTGKGAETYKKQTQSGILIDAQQWDLLVGGKPVDYKSLFNALNGETDFAAHLAATEKLGFELLVKRAKVGQAKHVRVRPLFRDWTAMGTLTVLDEQQSGLTKELLGTILNQSGALVGLGDWRPSSPRASGSYGKFSATLKKM